ncbi:F-box only protein 16 [Clonorchis sinensis]|uniref:F-box only protein 16 n=1 Tax=Clonorchis sinensis TaxID=79923 RepID=A0A8T1LWI0_CLOSI|nr:F-box only protein 16 [Clonorchis sinensis]
MRNASGDAAKEYLKSTWTPLNDAALNSQIFQERRQLLSSWFSKWTDRQRRQVILDILPLCTTKQMEFLENAVRDKIPKHSIDFTRVLPRVLNFYIFSFLDPRSLCRCSQVCWYWKYLTEANELWAPKCIRRGWNLLGTKNISQPGIWKMHYVEKVIHLKASWPIKAAALEIMDQLDKVERDAREQLDSRSKKAKTEILPRRFIPQKDRNEPDPGSTRKPVPWRGPDKRPQDTRRLNYFDNIEGAQETSRTQSGQLKMIRSDRGKPQNSPEWKLHRESTNPVPDSVKPASMNAFRINPVISGPREPWRPNSKYPKRQTQTVTGGHRRQSGNARRNTPIYSQTALTTPLLKEDARDELDPCYETAMIDIAVIGSVEDLPLPPTYSKQEMLQKSRVTQMIEPIDDVKLLSPPPRRASMSTVEVHPGVQGTVGFQNMSPTQKPAGSRNPRAFKD